MLQGPEIWGQHTYFIAQHGSRKGVIPLTPMPLWF
jgi:hypothetical protein